MCASPANDLGAANKKRPPNPAIKDKVSFTFSWIAIVIRGIVGTIVSLFVYSQALRIESEDTLGRFLMLSSSEHTLLKKHLQYFLKDLESIGYLYKTDSKGSKKEAFQFVEDRMRGNAFIELMRWIPKNKNPYQNLDSMESQAYEKAISAKEVSAALKVTNQNSPASQTLHLIVFVPILNKTDLVGVMQGMIDVSVLIKSSILAGYESAMNVFIYRGVKDLDSKPLYRYEGEPAAAKEVSLENLLNEPYTEQKRLSFADLKLDMVYQATASYTEHTWQAFIASSIGFLITSVIVVTAWILLEIEKRQFTNVLHEEHVQEMEVAIDQLETTKNRLVAQENLASLGGLTAGIAHEIKNPLNFINNFSLLSVDLVKRLDNFVINNSKVLNQEEMEDLKESVRTLQENINTIHEQGKRADTTIQRMLAHSRGKPGDWVSTDIHKLLNEYINFSFHGMRAKNSNFNVKIEKEFDENVKNIEVVASDMSRVFLNLLNNAFQSVEEKKRISKENYVPQVLIRTHNIGNYLRIRIKDNGMGISEENKTKIFTPFFTTKPPGVGTGLGLSLSYNIIVREHGGSLTFDTKENEFCEFIITIPLKAKKEKEVVVT